MSVWGSMGHLPRPETRRAARHLNRSQKSLESVCQLGVAMTRLSDNCDLMASVGPTSKHLSAEEAALVGGVSTRTILRWAQRGLVGTKWAYGRRWFRRSDIELKARQRGAGA